MSTLNIALAITGGLFAAATNSLVVLGLVIALCALVAWEEA